MIQERPLLPLFDYGFLKRLFLLVLLLGLLFIAEIVMYAWAFKQFSAENVLALTAGTGFLGFFWVAGMVRSLLKRILKSVKEGVFPEPLVVKLLGVLAGGFMVMLPGFIMDAFGLLILLTFFKRIAGRILLGLYGPRIKGAYEYLKLS